jgi:(1->4)-alpha-D-glucan 1-alpha-D-glucosylmutase
MNPQEHEVYVRRVDSYMQKALHEAKVHTSWVNPSSEYEKAVTKFIERLLEPSPENLFLQDLRQFQGPVARAGLWNSLSQLLLKIASPGVPDFYQGNDLWAFDLVDPDNRRPVDYAHRRQMLKSLQEQAARDRVALVDRLRENPCDGAIKLFVTSEALRFRRDHRDLFAQGSYTALAAEGNRSRHVVAFARATESQTVIAVIGRFFLKLCNSHAKPVGDVFGNTTIALPKNLGQSTFRDVFTGETISAEQPEGRQFLSVSKVFSHCPVALLYAERAG